MTNEINMNVEEDAELRELLISNLESRGVLSRIKADLRAAIFQCLDEKSQSGESGISAADQVPLSLCTDLFESLGLHSTNKASFFDIFIYSLFKNLIRFLGSANRNPV